MKLARPFAVAALGMTLAVACGDDGPGVVTLDDLVGTWNATQFELTNPADQAQSFDFIQNGGTVTLTIAANGAFNGEQTLFGFTDTFGGMVVISGNRMTVTDTQDPTEVTVFTFSLSGNTLSLTSTDIEWDWDNDGNDDSATLDGTMVRQ
jgi:hypothetical protein